MQASTLAVDLRSGAWQSVPTVALTTSHEAVARQTERGHTGSPAISMTDPRPTTNGLSCTSRCGGEERGGA
jgi:hypothetical protein